MKRADSCSSKALSIRWVLDFALGNHATGNRVRKRRSTLDVETQFSRLRVNESTSGASESTYATECASDNWDSQRNSLLDMQGFPCRLKRGLRHVALHGTCRNKPAE